MEQEERVFYYEKPVPVTEGNVHDDQLALSGLERIRDGGDEQISDKETDSTKGNPDQEAFGSER